MIKITKLYPEVGAIAVRRIALTGPVMELVISEVNDQSFHCGSWEFNTSTGGEIDDFLGWDGITRTGSVVTEIRPALPVA